MRQRSLLMDTPFTESTNASDKPAFLLSHLIFVINKMLEDAV